MSKKKVLLRGVFINRDTNGEGVLKVGTTLIRVSTVMGILYIADGKVDIPKEMINETIQNNVKEMVETTARWKVNDACNKAVREVETSLFNKISESAENAVKQAYKSMEIDAKEKIAKELRNIDVSDLKNEVKEEAAQLVKDKLSSQMDDILDTYNANLMNVQNIYSSIAKSMSARA